MLSAVFTLTLTGCMISVNSLPKRWAPRTCPRSKHIAPPTGQKDLSAAQGRWEPWVDGLSGYSNRKLFSQYICLHFDWPRSGPHSQPRVWVQHPPSPSLVRPGAVPRTVFDEGLCWTAARGSHNRWQTKLLALQVRMILRAHTHNNARSQLWKHDQVVFTIYRHHTEWLCEVFFFFVNPSRSGIQLWLPRTVRGLTWNHHRTLAPMKFCSKKKCTYWCQINQHHESTTRECWGPTTYP